MCDTVKNGERDRYGENRFLLVSIGCKIRVCAVQMFPLIGLLPVMLRRSDAD
jgi:hypothetical protein